MTVLSTASKQFQEEPFSIKGKTCLASGSLVVFHLSNEDDLGYGESAPTHETKTSENKFLGNLTEKPSDQLTYVNNIYSGIQFIILTDPTHPGPSRPFSQALCQLLGFLMQH